MIRRFFALFLCFALSIGSAFSNPRSVGFAGKRADRVEEKKVERKVWAQPGRSALQDKTFPIAEWSKHYSPLGTKRAPISVDEQKSKKRFEAKNIELDVVPKEISRWNERLAELHQQAGIRMDDEARITADRKLYHMALQDPRRYEELAEELSLRDINRFQFRSNRSDESVPVQRAGEGE